MSRTYFEVGPIQIVINSEGRTTLEMFRTDDGSPRLERPKVINGCDETLLRVLFTCSTNYLYPSKRKQIPPNLTYMYTDVKKNRDLPTYTTTIK